MSIYVAQELGKTTLKTIYKQSRKILFKPWNVGTAFVSIGSKMVGSSYRIQDSYDPRLRQAAVSPDPTIVIKREVISLIMTWVFALFISQVTHSFRTKLKIGALLAQFLAVVFSNVLSEGISRYLSYRQFNQNHIRTLEKPEANDQEASPPIVSTRRVYHPTNA